jgi:tRNA uridine 5-carbamoylmethylation protein Kti12
MIIRQLLDRLENPDTGDMLESSLFVQIPEERNKQIDAMIKVVGDKFLDFMPWYDKTQPLDKMMKDTFIRNTWKPTLVVTGCDGLPDTLYVNFYTRSRAIFIF